jgi:hypothetical protein
MTSKVQVLDVGINKPFKSHMNNSWLPFLLQVIEDDNQTQCKKVERKEGLLIQMISSDDDKFKR